MNKIKRSVKLLKAAFAIMFREKKLFLFPLITTVLALGIALFFIAPIAFYPTGHSVLTSDHWNAVVQRISQSINFVHLQVDKPTQVGPVTVTGTGTLPWFAMKPLATVFFAAAYFVSMFLATFSNVAFYHEIMRALNGDTVSIRRGYQFALKRWRSVLLWSLFAGLVGYLIQTIQERFGLLGRFITGLMGFAWSAACIFIIPTLVRDTVNTNPFKLLKGSVETLQRTWGETVIGFAGIGILSALSMATMIIGVVLAFGLPMFIFSGANPRIEPRTLMWILGGMLFVAVLMATFLSYAGGLLNSIYRCALYIYATEGVVPGTFDKELLDSAWKVK